MTPAVRLLLVDDDPLVVAGLRLMLTGDPTLEVVGDVSDGDELVPAVRATRPDVVLLDVRMARVDGLAALRRLRAEPGLGALPAVLVLTTFDSEPVLVDALRAGAAGFLLKHTPPAEIVRAVRAAAAGEPTVSPPALRRLMDHVVRGGPAAAEEDRPRDDVLAVLTEREQEVALAVAEGLGNAEIARRLYISQGSVKVHVSSALAKLGLENRTRLAVVAHEAGRRRQGA